VQRTETCVWDEKLIDERTIELIEVLLKVWPVPEGHHGKVVDPQTKAADWVELKHLLEAELLAPGTVLRMNHRDFRDVTAVVAPDGSLELDGKRFQSPSGAGKHVLKRSSNGWYYWSLPDGRRLRDLKHEFMNAVPEDTV
jgi:hypothetical protein